MSEEAKDQQEPVEEKKEEAKATVAKEAAETTEVKEEAKAPEVKEEAKAPETEEKAPEEKVKKINRLTKDQVNTKIAEMETKKLEKSIYYKHLVQRRTELEGYTAE